MVSDVHDGLVKAHEEALTGSMWQECQTHFMRRALLLKLEVDKAAFSEDLQMILQASSREHAEEEKSLQERNWGK